MSDDLETAWAEARRSLAWADYKALLNAGVPKTFLARAMAEKCLGVDDIAVKNGLWMRRFRGERAIVIPEMSQATGQLTNLVAFHSETPRSFWRMLDGGAPFLGPDAIERAEHFNEPLMVHETPIEWLRAECEGVVILDWNHYWPLYLGGVKQVRTASIEFGRRLRDTLMRPLPIPEIQVAA